MCGLFNAQNNMRYPNLRYGNPTEFEYYSLGIPTKDLARQLLESEETITAWRTGTKKIPWYIPEILRLRRFEHYERMRQMNITVQRRKFGLVGNGGDLVEFERRKPEPIPRPDRIAGFVKQG